MKRTEGDWTYWGPFTDLREKPPHGSGYWASAVRSDGFELGASGPDQAAAENNLRRVTGAVGPVGIPDEDGGL